MDLVSLLFRANTKELDDASKKLDLLGNKASDVDAKARKVGDGFGSIGGPIGDVASRVEDLKSRASGAIGTFGVLGTTVAVVGTAAAAAVAGMVRLALSVADVADAMNDMANRTNVSTERLTVYDALAKMAGSSVDALVGSSEKLGMKLAKQDEDTGRAVIALKELGISTKNAAGETKSMLELQEEIVLAADKATDSAKAEGAAVQLLGTDYYKLRTAVKETALAKSEMYDYMKNVGAVVTTKLAKDSDNLNDNISKLGLSFTGMGNSIASVVIPILNSVIEKITSISEQAAALIRKYTGNSTGSEKAEGGVQDIETRLARAKKQRDGFDKSATGAIVEKNAALIKSLEAELDIANADLRQAKRLDSKDKSDAISGKAGDGNRVAGKDGSGGKSGSKGKTDPLAWMKEPGYAGELGKAQDRANLRNADNDAAERAYDANKLNAFKLAHEAIEKAKKSADDLQKSIDQLTYNTPIKETERLHASVSLLDTAFFDGKISAELHAQSIAALTGKNREAAESFNMMERVGLSAFKGLEDSLVGFAETGKFSFKDLVSSILGDIMRLFVQMQIIAPLMAILRSMMGIGGSSGGAGSISGGVGLKMSAKGNVFDGPTLHGYSGGIGMLGEAGPEAVMPLKRGSDGKLGVVSAGGGGAVQQNINLTVNVEGGNTNEETGNVVSAKVIQMVKGVVKQELALDKRTRAYSA